ncbi:MAG: AcrB/AcrD/AcrF family protein [Planctomycetota bacterium]|nr:MAG: AcrB/AcrD/AcrF family protein [Planctomycetota bacterium]
MIRGLVDFSLDNRPLVLVLWLLVISTGLFSLKDLPVDAVPDITNVQVQVLTNAPGLAPEEVERLISFPVENAMSGLPQLDELRSISRAGVSVVTVAFEEGTDLFWARQLVGERLASARDQIPETYGSPEIGPPSTGLGEIYQFEVRGRGYTPMELRTILEWNVNFHLRSVPGIVEVNPAGGFYKTYQISLDPAKLEAFQLSLGEVFERVEKSNLNVGGGYLARSGEQFLIRGKGQVQSLQDLAEIVVRRDDFGTPIRVGDLGKVELAPMIRKGSVTRDGRGEAVIGIAMMLIGANSRTVAKAVHEKIQEIDASLPPGVTIDTWYDRTELVDRTIRTVATNLLEGGLLVILVLLLLLGNLRGGFMVASAIPLSMLAAFTAMRYAGISGNLMSLGALDFGLIVDGSVVMVENIVRQIRLRRDDSKTSHKEKVRQACHEVARPVVFAVGIIMVVYLPILALRGIEGRMFRPMAFTVVFALGASLLCALTLMPVLASFLLKKPQEKDTPLYRLAKAVYRPSLRFCLAHPWWIGSAAIGIFASSLLTIPLLGAEFIPTLDEGAIALQVERLPSVSLQKSNEISTLVERTLRSFPEVRTVVSRTGSPEIATDPMGLETSDVYVMLHPPQGWDYDSKEDLVAAMEERISTQVPGVFTGFTQPIELRMSELISGVRSDVGIKIFAPNGDLQQMKQVADEVARVIAEVPGMVDVKAEQILGLPNLNIEPRRADLARLGMSVDEVMDVVQCLAGRPLGSVFEGERRFPLQARFQEISRDDLQEIRNLRIALPADSNGERGFVPLSQVADVELLEGPAQISREKVSRRISVEANVRQRDLASAVAEARKRVEAEVNLPPGWTVEWGGQFKNLASAAQRLSYLVPLALLLIFIFLYSAFSSSSLAFLILLNVPLAVTGGVFALLARGFPFSISAAVGFIALFGIATMNGVVLVSMIQQRRREGMNARQAAENAANTRLRAVMMTAFTATIGFVPMALATSAGAEVQRPLATVVIGGLLTCTVLTLLVLPSLYARLWRGEKSMVAEEVKP